MIITRTGKKLLMAGVASLIAIGGGINVVRANPTVQAFNQSLNATNEIQIYGQVPQPQQIRKGYLVFQRYGDQVVGATYQPLSEFSCFVGELKNYQLDIDYLSPQGQPLNTTQIDLLNLHRFNTPSADDKRMLSTCLQQPALALTPETKSR